jgi:hypothetical protein
VLFKDASCRNDVDARTWLPNKANRSKKIDSFLADIFKHNKVVDLKTRIFPNMLRSHGELFSSVQSNSQAGGAYEKKEEHDSDQTLACRLSDIPTLRKALSHFTPSKNPLHSMP